MYFLVWRDIKVRYKQTVLGAGWAILRPFLSMVVFSVIFGQLAKMPSDGIPYPIFAFAALVPWTFCADATTRSANCLVHSSDLIKKIYFPRMIVPFSAVMAGFLDFALAFLVLLGMMPFLKCYPTHNILWLPGFTLLMVVTAMGVGLWLSALNVQFRDVGYTVPFLTQLWMFVTPIVYPSSLLPERWRALFGINPMSGVVEGFRWALLGTQQVPGKMILVSTLVAVSILVSGAIYFRRKESLFADVV